MSEAPAGGGWFVYVVQCADDSLYCGITNDLERRMVAHDAGRGARYTRGRGPVRLLDSVGPMPRGDALRLEARVKRARRTAKLVRLRAALPE